MISKEPLQLPGSARSLVLASFLVTCGVIGSTQPLEVDIDLGEAGARRPGCGCLNLPRVTSSFLLLVTMHFVTSGFLLLVVSSSNALVTT